MYGQKKNLSTFSYKLVQISPIMILVNSGAFLSISSWFCELTELIFVMIPYISSTGYPPKTQGIMGHVQVANESWMMTTLYHFNILTKCHSSPSLFVVLQICYRPETGPFRAAQLI